MPYFKKGQWENSDEDRQFRDQLIVLLVNLGFEVRSKIFEEVIRQTKSEAKEQCATILTSIDVYRYSTIIVGEGTYLIKAFSLSKAPS